MLSPPSLCTTTTRTHTHALTHTQQRAHTLFARAFAPLDKPDALPALTEPRRLLALLMEHADPPPFSAAAREAAGRKGDLLLDLAGAEDRDAELPFAF